jgi:hypothetical protein
MRRGSDLVSDRQNGIVVGDVDLVQDRGVVAVAILLDGGEEGIGATVVKDEGVVPDREVPREKTKKGLAIVSLERRIIE